MQIIGNNGIGIEVLLVEDSPGDVRLTQEAFHGANPAVHLNIAADGAEAIGRFLNREGKHSKAPRPDLILLDLNHCRKWMAARFCARIKTDNILKTLQFLR